MGKKMALVLQGGGALGAYEYGVVTKLIEMGWEPVAVSGVSIGAVNAAAIAGARDGDIAASLKAVWDQITMKTFPFLPANMQGNFSLLGNPNFWQSRTDYLQMGSWTSFCDTKPMYRTLEQHLDFDRINRVVEDGMPAVRLAVTATSLETGGPMTFSNYLHSHGTGADVGQCMEKLNAVKQTIRPEHIMASGALPPGFPPVVIDDCAYWDGGLFSNTPIDALLNILTEEEYDTLPIFTIDLFATGNLPIPKNLIEVQTRALAMQYENRFWAEFGGSAGLKGFLAMLKTLEAVLPKDSILRKDPADNAEAAAWDLRAATTTFRPMRWRRPTTRAARPRAITC
jgi:NTE family protein